MRSGRSQSSGSGGSRGCFSEHRQNVCLSVYVKSMMTHKSSLHRHTSILVYFFDAYGHYVDLVDICRQVPKNTFFLAPFVFLSIFSYICRNEEKRRTMTTDLNKVLEKDAKGRLIDLYNIIQNEDITRAEGLELKNLFETELRAMKAVSNHLRGVRFDPSSEEGMELQLRLCQKVLNGESLS